MIRDCFELLISVLQTFSYRITIVMSSMHQYVSSFLDMYLWVQLC